MLNELDELMNRAKLGQQRAQAFVANSQHAGEEQEAQMKEAQDLLGSYQNVQGKFTHRQNSFQSDSDGLHGVSDALNMFNGQK